MDGRVRVETPECHRQRHAGCLLLAPLCIHCHGKVGCRHRCIPAKTAGRTDMVLAADDICFRIAEIAGNSAAYRKRHLHLGKAGGLLDMNLQKRPYGRGINGFFPAGDCLRIAAAFGYMFGQCPVCIDPAGFEPAIRQATQCRPAADIGNSEPDAFFRPDAHGDDIAGGLDAQVFQGGDYRQSGDNPCSAIEIAAMRNAVEMRAHDD
ncbi:hypothetical protein D3C73_843290 [compost metagenome]